MKYKIIIFFLFVPFLISAQTEKRDTKQKQILYKLKYPSKNYILVVAHRGAWHNAPENSLLAVKHAIDMGVDVAEIDIRMTKDSQLVLMHDPTVDRTTNGKGKVSELTLAEIKKLRLKNAVGVQWIRQQIPTLEEVMLVAKEKIMINLDKTEDKTLKECFEVLKKTGTINHVIFKGNDSVQVMRKKFGNLMDSIIYMPKVWYSLPNIPAYVEAFNTSMHPIVYEMIFDTIKSPVFSQIAEMNKKNISVMAIALWDALCAGHSDEMAAEQSYESAYGWLIKNGANAIMTDNPEGLLDYLRKKKLHN